MSYRRKKNTGRKTPLVIKVLESWKKVGKKEDYVVKVWFESLAYLHSTGTRRIMLHLDRKLKEVRLKKILKAKPKQNIQAKKPTSQKITVWKKLGGKAI